MQTRAWRLLHAHLCLINPCPCGAAPERATGSWEAGLHRGRAGAGRELAGWDLSGPPAMLVGFAGDLALQRAGKTLAHVVQRLSKGSRQLPASFGHRFLARGTGMPTGLCYVRPCLLVQGSRADHILPPYPRGSDVLQRLVPLLTTPCPSLRALVPASRLALQAPGPTDGQTWLLQHVPAELKLLLTQLKLSTVLINTEH